MGSDCYNVTVQTYREHTTEQAIARLAAYGWPPEPGTFFTGEGPWIEIRLDVRCVHPDAPIGWDPLLVIRWLDEAVYRSARSDGSGFDFEKTPLADAYPGLWKMGRNIEREDESAARIVAVEFRKNPHPREGRASDPYGDTATIAAFIHKKYAPNIAGFDFWESRAWGGGGWYCRNWPEARRPILAEIRSIAPSAQVSSAQYNEYSSMAPRPEGGIWAATPTQLHAVTAEGGGRAEVVLDILSALKQSGIRHLAVQQDGTLWMATTNAVIRRAPGGDTTVHVRGEALQCKKIECLAASPDGHVFVGAENGLHCLGPDGRWAHVRDGLADRAVRQVTALPGGVAWAVGSRHPTRRNADGSLDKFQARQGVDSAHRALALPGGGTWALPWAANPAYVAPGAGRAVPDELCPRVMPGGVRHGAIGPDSALWCIAQRGFLARLRQGDTPRVYAWNDQDLALWNNAAEICVSGEGDVWVRLGDGRLVAVRAADIAAADASPPMNADMPHLKGITPVSFGPAAPVQAAAPAIDFKGKTVVITGTLSKLTRDEAQRALSERGASLSDSVNKKTHYLIAGIKPSSKLQKAQSLGIPVLTEDVLLAAPTAPTQTAQAASGTLPEPPPAPSAADLAQRFPLSDQPAGNTSHLDAAMMRKMAQSKPPVTTKEWKALLKKHKVFIDAGGGNGTWQVLEVSGLLLGALQGYRPDTGEQASLYLRQLPSGFDARKAQLSWLNGCGMFAEGVDFCGASLQKSLLSDSFLAGARFDSADLSGVDFSRADLRGASFKGASLTGADFEGCDLTGADFTGARLDEARFPGAKLEGVKG